jgi:hypothetical protein
LVSSGGQTVAAVGVQAVGIFGHVVSVGGQSVSFARHLLISCGHFVSDGGHRVSVAGHFVGNGGQVVAAVGQTVSFDAHVVNVGGHCVSTCGQMVWTDACTVGRMAPTCALATASNTKTDDAAQTDAMTNETRSLAIFRLRVVPAPCRAGTTTEKCFRPLFYQLPTQNASTFSRFMPLFKRAA